MAFVAGQRTRVYVGQYDLSAYLNNVTATRNADNVDVTCFGNDDRDFLQAMRSSTVTASGFVDPATGASEPVIASILASASNTPVSIYWDADAISSPGICGATLSSSYENTAAVDGIQAIATNLTFTGMVARAISLHALGAETAIGSYTANNNGASSSNGAVANLHVTAAGSSGTGTVVIQDSADNITFATIITFTNFTAATSETKEYTGTVRQYVRANLTSARNTQTFNVAFGRR